MRYENPDYESISLVKSAVGIPVYANGDINSYNEALEIVKSTKVDGNFYSFYFFKILKELWQLMAFYLIQHFLLVIRWRRRNAFVIG